MSSSSRVRQRNLGRLSWLPLVGDGRCQYKPTLKGDARIWFYVDGNTVLLEQVHTQHANQTKYPQPEAWSKS
jgi:hypothetical protein